MPVVFVHGVPETAAIWTPLIAELGRDDVDHAVAARLRRSGAGRVRRHVR